MTSAEALHDRQQSDSARAIEAHLEQALDNVIERVMSGKRVPKSGYPAIDLWDFIDQRVSLHDQMEWLVMFITTGDRDSTHYKFLTEIERRLRSHLMGSQIVRDRAEELAQEDEEEHQ